MLTNPSFLHINANTNKKQLGTNIQKSSEVQNTIQIQTYGNHCQLGMFHVQTRLKDTPLVILAHTYGSFVDLIKGHVDKK